MANHTRIRGYEHDQEGTASRGEKRRYRWASEVGYQDLRTGCLSLNEKGLCTYLIFSVIFATQPYQLGALLPRLDIWFQAIQLYPYHADLATPHPTASSDDHRVLGRLLFP